MTSYCCCRRCCRPGAGRLRRGSRAGAVECRPRRPRYIRLCVSTRARRPVPVLCGASTGPEQQLLAEGSGGKAALAAAAAAAGRRRHAPRMRRPRGPRDLKLRVERGKARARRAPVAAAEASVAGLVGAQAIVRPHRQLLPTIAPSATFTSALHPPPAVSRVCCRLALSIATPAAVLASGAPWHADAQLAALVDRCATYPAHQA